MRKLQKQIAQGLIGLDTFWYAKHRLASEFSGFFVFVIKEQLLHPSGVLQSIWVVGVAGTTVPKGFFVELNTLSLHTTEHHSTEPSFPMGSASVHASAGF